MYHISDKVYISNNEFISIKSLLQTKASQLYYSSQENRKNVIKRNSMRLLIRELLLNRNIDIPPQRGCRFSIYSTLTSTKNYNV